MAYLPRADAPLGYNPLSYSDPTGDAVVRRLEGDLTITWPDGFMLRIEQFESGPLVNFLTTVYHYQTSRKGHVWGRIKKGPGRAAATAPRPETPSPEGVTNA